MLPAEGRLEIHQAHRKYGKSYCQTAREIYLRDPSTAKAGGSTIPSFKYSSTPHKQKHFPPPPA
jgi:hypothetical protein